MVKQDIITQCLDALPKNRKVEYWDNRANNYKKTTDPERIKECTEFKVPIPKVGKQYNFYDDGKIRQSRRYTATVLRIVSVEDAKSLMFPIYVYEESDWIPTTIASINEDPIGETSLYTVWKENVEEYYWVFATETDCLIECSIPKYDDYPIWFARMGNGNWFSLNIQSVWQGGLLDIDNYLTEELEEWMKE